MVNNIIHEYIRVEKSKIFMANIFRRTMHYKRSSIANWYEFAIKPLLLIEKNWLYTSTLILQKNISLNAIKYNKNLTK